MTSPVISDDPTPIDSDRPIELAPSEVEKEEPSFARTVGMTAAGLAFLGGAALLSNHFDGPKLLNKSLAATLIIFGMVGMLYHAARDTEQEVRRTYGYLGYASILLSLILTVANKSLLPYGALGLFSSLCFLSFFARNETDENWRRPVLIAMGGLGIVSVLALFWAVLFSPAFLVSGGLVLGLLGLGFVCNLIGQFGSTTDNGRLVATVLGASGLLMIVYSIIRSFSNPEGPPFFVPYGLILTVIGTIYVLTAIGILSDNPIVVMVRRELMTYFYSPIAYFVLLGMTGMGLLNFFGFVSALMREVPEPIVGRFIFDLAGIIAPICVVPVITMRLLSEEKRTGTYEVLMSVPISEVTVVLSKFLAALVFFMVIWIPWGIYLIGLQAELKDPFDYRPLISFGLALLFTGASFVSMGLFFSSLTRNQIIAAVLTLAGMLALTTLWIFRNSDIASPLWRTVFDKLCYLRVWDDSLSGQLPLHDLVLHASVTIFWLFLTVKSLETRKWN
jgi:ABC-2 type transport system permease protein